MALLGKEVKRLNAIMIVKNITTLISKGPEEALHTEQYCISKYANYAFDEGAVFCNTTFDTYLCWPPTKANTVIQQHCPKVRLSDPSKFAYRQCGPEGLWEGRHANQANAKGWTNFTPCFPPDLQALIAEVFNEHNVQTKFQIAENTRIIEIIGYTLSLFTILASIIIFCYYKSLLNKRVKIHKCLFLAMLFQILVHMTLYLDQALYPINDSSNRLNNTKGIDGTPNLCEALYVVMESSISATFMWILLEGIYLNFLVSKYALQSNFDLKIYLYIGWGFPFILTLIWAIINFIFYKDEKIKTCWFGYNLAASYWCLQGPRLAIILVNVVILCRVLKTVIAKLRAHKTSEIEKIKKAVKAALLLLPLLGITNLLTTFDIPISTNVSLFRVWCYTRQFMKSFQGFFLSLIYCFFNGEVRTVIGRRINNRTARYFHRNQLSVNTKRPTPKRKAVKPLPTVSSDVPQVGSQFDSNEPSTSKAGIPVRVDVNVAGPSGHKTNV
nr:PDF receptor [Vanessa tameamea]